MRKQCKQPATIIQNRQGSERIELCSGCAVPAHGLGLEIGGGQDNQGDK